MSWGRLPGDELEDSHPLSALLLVYYILLVFLHYLVLIASFSAILR